MRKKKRQIYILVLVLILILSFFILFSDILWGKKSKKIYQISIIIRGKNTESWTAVKQGIDQAAFEVNADISFITLSKENSVDEQIALLQREVNNGADAILISPADYEKMVESIENAMSKLPVVLIESSINSNKNLPYISCDNYGLGVSLAESVIQMGNERSEITIIESGLECSSIRERYNGFMDTIKKSKNTYTILEFPVEDQLTYNQAEELLKKNVCDVVVTFDSDTLEVIAQAKKELSKVNEINLEVYGIGSTGKILSLLEEKVINSTAVQNEFNVGYLGVKTAVDMLSDKKINNIIIESTVVTMRNMYSNENQRLLFPFIR